jgi:hypothetical protein
MLAELRKYKKKGAPKTRITKYNQPGQPEIDPRNFESRQMPLLTTTPAA